MLRFNAEGLAELSDRPYGRRPECLSDGEQAAFVAHVLRRPNPERGEPSNWTLPDLCRFIETRFSKTMCPQSMSRLVRRLGLSRQKARPVHSQRNAKAAEAFEKRGLAEAVEAARAAHRDSQIELWFQDEARVGQKARTSHR